MRRALVVSSALGMLTLLAACDTPAPADPVDGLAFAATGERQIRMLDECDPESFNAALGPGTCVRTGGITFDKFIQMLERRQTVPSWRFSPDVIHVAREVTLPIVNAGGEAHTFTEVEEFGGGIVPELNALMGLDEVAPECMALLGTDFVAPGGQTTHTFEPGEDDKYMCCIHPWMRATTR